jgi:peptidoglycan/xylan/chitin deacetylase (PgdA/CDA1 family)
MRWNRATAQPFLDVRTAVLNDTLEDAFRRRYPRFRPTNGEIGCNVLNRMTELGMPVPARVR